MAKDVKSMSREELEAELLRLRDKMRDDAMRCAREIELAKRAFDKKPLESPKGMGR